MHSTLLSIGSMKMYSSEYSTAIDWTTSIVGITTSCGAGSPMFVKDGVT